MCRLCEWLPLRQHVLYLLRLMSVHVRRDQLGEIGSLQQWSVADRSVARFSAVFSLQSGAYE